MTRSPLQRVVDRLASARFAIALMIVLGVLSFLATLVPQESAQGAAEVARWAQANPAAESIVRAVGFHTAYTSWVFLIPAALLFASTTVCAWRRTGVARKRMSALRELGGSVPVRPDTSYVASGMSAELALERVGEALRDVGVPTVRRGDRIVAATKPWVTLASPVFHWSLVALMLVVTAWQLTRAEGLAGVPVGGSIKLEDQYFPVLDRGPFHQWLSDVTVGVERLEPSYVFEGIERGPTPTVVVSSSQGVVASQRVYPNAALQTGSLTIHANDYGLSATFSLVGPDGAVIAEAPQIIDFSESTTSGVVPGEFSLTGAEQGQAAYTVRVVVPLERNDGQPVRLVPRVPRAEVAILDPTSGSVATSGVLAVGESLALPTEGYTLRLDAVDYYARLSIVQDSSIVAIYVLLAIALVSVSAALLLRQRVVLVWSDADDESGEVVVHLVSRLWRNAGVLGSDVRQAVARAIDANERM